MMQAILGLESGHSRSIFGFSLLRLCLLFLQCALLSRSLGGGRGRNAARDLKPPAHESFATATRGYKVSGFHLISRRTNLAASHHISSQHTDIRSTRRTPKAPCELLSPQASILYLGWTGSLRSDNLLTLLSSAYNTGRPSTLLHGDIACFSALRTTRLRHPSLQGYQHFLRPAQPCTSSFIPYNTTIADSLNVYSGNGSLV